MGGWQDGYGGGSIRPLQGRRAVGVNTPHPSFAGMLRAAGLSQTEFRELVERLAGQRVAQTTTSRWVKGTRAAPPCALALLGLVARIPPAELHRLLAD